MKCTSSLAFCFTSAEGESESKVSCRLRQKSKSVVSKTGSSLGTLLLALVNHETMSCNESTRREQLNDPLHQKSYQQHSLGRTAKTQDNDNIRRQEKRRGNLTSLILTFFGPGNKSTIFSKWSDVRACNRIIKSYAM